MPSQSHTITPSPTSVTVFIGYTHPFKTVPAWGTPTLIFSFTDYERLFGGLYNTPSVDGNVAYAVQQFFLNGGSQAIVVPLQPQAVPQGSTYPAQTPFFAATAIVTAISNDAGNMVFSALEPADATTVMTVTISNQKSPVPYASTTLATGGSLPQSIISVVSTAGFSPTGGTFTIPALNTTVTYGGVSGNTLTGCTGGSGTMVAGQTVTEGLYGYAVADITLAYGSKTEVYRGVTVDHNNSTLASYIVNALANSGLAKVAIGANTSPSPQYPYGLFPPFSSTAPSATPPAPQSLTFLYPYFGNPSNTPTPSLAASPQFGDFYSNTQPGNVLAPLQVGSLLDKIGAFNLLVTPGITDAGVFSAGVSFCEYKRAFYIMDMPPKDLTSQSGPPPAPWPDITGVNTLISALGFSPTNVENLITPSINAAIYFPNLVVPDPVTGGSITLPPSGSVAGIYARIDQNRGVWKAPAGLETTINNTTGVVSQGLMTDMQAGVLNKAAIDAIRTFPGQGTVVFGARTVAATNSAFQQWWYVPVRRTALFIEQTLSANLSWAIFEPNDVPLWNALKATVERFMLSLFRQGAFQGTTPSDAFLVKCDASTTTQTDVDNGVVNILVGFAPLKPAEFVIIQITQLAGQASS